MVQYRLSLKLKRGGIRTPNDARTYPRFASALLDTAKTRFLSCAAEIKFPMLPARRLPHRQVSLRPALATAVLALGLCAAGVQAQQQPAGAGSPGNAALAPPPGTLMGAYGLSQQVTPPATPGAAGHIASKTAPAPLAPADLAAAAAAGAGSAGAAAGNDAITRFLQDTGLMKNASENRILNQVRDTASDLVMSAMNFLGVPYKRGGKSLESGFDCSGFTRHIFEMSVGLVLPHRADEQARLSSLIPIKQEELKPGDLVFFNTMKRTFSHVGIYVGDGKFIHSPRVGSAVRVEDLREAYWAKRFTGARRADLAAAQASADNRSAQAQSAVIR
jgi:cell wall-associated NlpC family hydrolase